MLVRRRNFNRSLWKSPWGVHDSVVLSRLLDDLKRDKGPTFAVTLTLSAHEPYEVPGAPVVYGTDPQHRFLNAQAYTDRAVAGFLARLRASELWTDALVIIVGDHGSLYPPDTAKYAVAPSQFRIPMIWTGGVLRTTGVVIDDVGSQVDIAALLLDQLQMDHSEFRWSKDFTRQGVPRFAFYAFPNGFGFVDGTGSVVFDNEGAYEISGAKPQGGRLVSVGRAFQHALVRSYAQMADGSISRAKDRQ